MHVCVSTCVYVQVHESVRVFARVRLEKVVRKDPRSLRSVARLPDSQPIPFSS